MHQIAVSARILKWPNVCACCMGPADGTIPVCHTRVTGRRVIRHDVRQWRVPCCSRCREHMDLAPVVEESRRQLELVRSSFRTIWAVGAVLVAIALFMSCAGFSLVASHAEDRSAGVPCLFFSVLICLAGVPGCVLWYISNAKRVESLSRDLRADERDLARLVGPSCACTWEPVVYADRSGSVHVFEFGSADYAKAFAQANASKVL